MMPCGCADWSPTYSLTGTWCRGAAWSRHRSQREARLNIVWTGFSLEWYQWLWHHAPLLRAASESARPKAFHEGDRVSGGLHVNDIVIVQAE